LRTRGIVDRTQKPTRRILARSENSKIGHCTLTERQPSPSGRRVSHHVKRGRPATSVHGLVLAVRRARAPAQSSGARARKMMRLYHAVSVDALVGLEFATGHANEDQDHGLRYQEMVCQTYRTSQRYHASEPIDYEHEHRPTLQTEHEHDGILGARRPERYPSPSPNQPRIHFENRASRASVHGFVIASFGYGSWVIGIKVGSNRSILR